ncbi:unnamed protein product [Knipowitschia caucasica]
MAASGSSERGPPAFPEDREPEAGHREPEDGDQEEGEDIFVNTSGSVGVSAGSSEPQTQSQPLSEPLDLFSEADPSAQSNTNGVHSDDEGDLFADARVEVSSSGPAPCTTPSFPPAQHTSLEQLEEDEEAKDSFDVDISVTSPEKVGDGMNAYVAYRVSTRMRRHVQRPQFSLYSLTAAEGLCNLSFTQRGWISLSLKLLFMYTFSFTDVDYLYSV